MEEKNNKTLGIYFISGSAFFFSCMVLFVKLSGDVPPIQKAFFRNFIASIFTFLILIKDRAFYVPSINTAIPLVLRALFGTLGIFCNFYAIDHMNIADAIMLNKLSPFFAIIASYIILKEKPSRFDYIATVVAFFGALLVIKPGFGMEVKYALIGVFGGFCAGMAYTFLRLLASKNVPIIFVVFFFSITSCFMSFIVSIGNFKSMTAIQLLYLVCSGFAAMGGQLCITKAYKYAPAKEISAFDYTQIVYSAVLGFLFFGEVSDVLSYIGFTLIIGMAIIKYKKFNN